MKKGILTVAMLIAAMGVKASNPKTVDLKMRLNYPVIIFEPNDESIMVGKLRRDGFKIVTEGVSHNVHTYILQRTTNDGISTVAFTFVNKELDSQVVSYLDI